MEGKEKKRGRQGRNKESRKKRRQRRGKRRRKNKRGIFKHSSPKIQSAKSSRVYYGLELVKEMRQEGKSSTCHWPLGHIYR